MERDRNEGGKPIRTGEKLSPKQSDLGTGIEGEQKGPFLSEPHFLLIKIKLCLPLIFLLR